MLSQKKIYAWIWVGIDAVGGRSCGDAAETQMTVCVKHEQLGAEKQQRGKNSEYPLRREAHIGSEGLL